MSILPLKLLLGSKGSNQDQSQYNKVVLFYFYKIFVKHIKNCFCIILVKTKKRALKATNNFFFGMNVKFYTILICERFYNKNKW